jgi:uncharacterized RDD family membrane protein YckC
VERSVEVTTGESVAFAYELAGVGSRFFAVFIDFALQVAIAVAGLLLLAWLASPNPAAHAKAGTVGKVVGPLVLTLAIGALFLLFFGYFIIFEWLWEGRTPGKRFVGIRVVRDGGFPVDFTSSVIRNVVRVLEFSLGFYAVSALVALASPQNKRLGDLAAGTLVVRDARYERVPSLSSPGAERDDPLVRELTPAERDLVRRYAERRAGLNDAARKTVAASIAAVVRPKLAVRFDHLGDDDLLVHLAESALR